MKRNYFVFLIMALCLCFSSPVYGKKSEQVKAVSISVTWGELEFTWSEGEWNSTEHIWENVGWIPDTDGGDRISVMNEGEETISVSFTYEQENTDVSGVFNNSKNKSITSINIKANETKTVSLELQGKPKKAWSDFVKLGTVKIVVEG